MASRHECRGGRKGSREGGKQEGRKGCWERLYHFSIRKYVTQFLGYSMMINNFKMGRECRREGSARQGCRQGGREAGRQGYWERLYHFSIRKHTYTVSGVQYDDQSFQNGKGV